MASVNDKSKMQSAVLKINLVDDAADASERQGTFVSKTSEGQISYENKTPAAPERQSTVKV